MRRLEAMTTRPEIDRKSAEDRRDVRPGTVFGREWWGWDRDRLEDELARQELGRQELGRQEQARTGGVRPN
jgi:hypothetical protein